MNWGFTLLKTEAIEEFYVGDQMTCWCLLLRMHRRKAVKAEGQVRKLLGPLWEAGRKGGRWGDAMGLMCGLSQYLQIKFVTERLTELRKMAFILYLSLFLKLYYSRTVSYSHLFIYFWLHWVFIAVHGLLLVAALRLLTAVASLVSKHGF